MNHQKIYGCQYHTLSIEQINSGVIAFLKANNMDAGSTGEFDFYQLLQAYIKHEEKRRQINHKVVATRLTIYGYYASIGIEENGRKRYNAIIITSLQD